MKKKNAILKKSLAFVLSISLCFSYTNFSFAEDVQVVSNNIDENGSGLEKLEDNLISNPIETQNEELGVEESPIIVSPIVTSEPISPTPILENNENVTITPIIEKSKIVEIVNVTNGTPYSIYNIDYKELPTIQNNFDSTISVWIEDVNQEKTNIDIPISWEMQENEYLSKYTFFGKIDEHEYELVENISLPYIEVNLNKTITSFTYDMSNPYASYDIDYTKKESIKNSFATEIETHINGNETITKIPITWVCDNYAENLETYIFNGNIGEEFELDENISLPKIEVNLSQTITGFAGWDGINPSLKYNLTYVEESNVDNFLTTSIYVYLNGTTTPTTIPITWTLFNRVVNIDNIVSTFKLNVLDSKYIIQNDLQQPTTEVNYSDGYAILTNVISYSNDLNVPIEDLPLWDSTTNYFESTIRAGSVLDYSTILPKTIYAKNNIDKISLVNIEWKCRTIYDGTKGGTYVFDAKIIDNIRKDVNFKTPYATIKIEEHGIVSFAGFEKEKAFKEIKEMYANKNLFVSSLPKTISVYFEDSIEPETINAKWVCEKDPIIVDEETFIYYLELPEGYSLSSSLYEEYSLNKKVIPFIVCTVSDYNSMSETKEIFNYNGMVQEYKAPISGKYLVTLYGAGAEGGTLFSKGGETYGYVNLEKGQTIYVVVGGEGHAYSTKNGGYNGGGNGLNNGGGGGGATHIALTNRGILSSYDNYRSEIIAVAGGCGGIPSSGNTFLSVGSGGGLVGQAVSGSDGVVHAPETSPTSGGFSFGQGQNGDGAGGGGYFGGYSASGTLYGGSGGCGYIGGIYNAFSNGGINSGNGWAIIEYKGDVTTTLEIMTNNGGTFNGENGAILIEGKAGETIELPDCVALPDFTFKGWKTISGDGIISIENKTYTFGLENTSIKAIWYRSLLLNGQTNIYGNNGQGSVDLSWEEDTFYDTQYKLYQIKDGATPIMIDNSGQSTILPKTASISGYYTNAAILPYSISVSGRYKLTVKGGKGGNDGGIGGNGGTSSAIFQLQKGTTLYLNAGGLGMDSYSYEYGGWNGGARSGTIPASGGGGGASHIAISYGELRYVPKENVLIVAGGGGGANNFGGNNYGSPGGPYGTTGRLAGTYGYGTGGSYSDGGGGGGGWVGGAQGYDHNGQAGGGTNYINTTNFTMSQQIENSAGSSGWQGYASIEPLEVYPVITGNGISVNTSDTASPNAPTNAHVSDTDGTNTMLTWDIPKDNGNTYKHYLVSCSTTDVSLNYDTSNTVTNYVETGVVGYRYYIDGNAIGTLTKTNGTFITEPSISMTKTTQKQYLHIASIDGAGNVSSTLNYEIPILYYITYNSNVSTNTSLSDTIIKDTRIFAFGTNYELLTNRFEKKGIGYYGQELLYNFVGWGFKPYSPYTKTNEIATYSYKIGLNTKVTNFLTGDPAYVSENVKSNSLDRPYYYDEDVFKNLATINFTNVNLYAEWIPENQKPYCGFNLLTTIFNNDGSMSDSLKEIPYDSYDNGSYNNTSGNAIVYDDIPVFLKSTYVDPENNVCEVEYQYSEDNGTTWYKLDMNATPKSFKITTTKLSNDSSLFTINFEKNKIVKIRMRARDNVSYSYKYVYNATTKSYTKEIIQKSLWSTGYYYDSSIVDYASNGYYYGDSGIKSNQGGAWYTKTINCYEGNKNPKANLIANKYELTSSSYNGLLNESISNDYFNVPMYNYTNENETYNYEQGKFFILLSRAEEIRLGGGTNEELIDKWNNAHGNLYADDYEFELIKESSDSRYTDFTPEDENIALIETSIDPDVNKHVESPTYTTYDSKFSKSSVNLGSVEEHEQFENYWVAICKKGTNEDILTKSSDVATTYNDKLVSNKTKYTLSYNGNLINGHIFNSYEEMIKYVYESYATLLSVDTDATLTMYDIYFAVNDKSWNQVSPNKWSSVEKYLNISEPALSFNDIKFSDKNQITPTYKNEVSLYKEPNGLKYTHIYGYTNENNVWKNLVNSETNTQTIAKIKHSNMKKNYSENSNIDFVSKNGTTIIKSGYYFDLNLETHGADSFSIAMLNNGNSNNYLTNDDDVYEKYKQLLLNGATPLIYSKGSSLIETKGVLMDKETRKSDNIGLFWKESKLNIGFMEQTKPNESYILAIEIDKTPYTRPNTKLARMIIVGSDGNPFIKIADSSSYNDIGIQLNN